MRSTYRALYRLGLTPWDGSALPAPLVTAVEGPTALLPGRAVDLGCGTGRQARYLAEHGWSVTAVDYVPAAVEAARRLDPDGRVDWRSADVTAPAEVDPGGRLAATVTLLLDNGCLHGVADTRRRGWAATVEALAAPGCVLLVRAAPRRRRGIGPRGVAAEEFGALLGRQWRAEAPPARGWYRCVRRQCGDTGGPGRTG